ncbi:mucin-5AC [Oncorhynchus masou masou]|uniref:mucin-5AC n=1 Tax=Oncorhynchus masou masou TaxID=90313 RepID=UPI003182CC04
MDDFVKNQFQNNVKIYTDNLERIVQKYSKLHDDGTEVNLEDITPQDVSRCMFKSELALSKLELSKSDAGLAELSLGDISEIHRPHDTTGDFKMDISYHQYDASSDCVDEGSVDTSTVTVTSTVTAPNNDSVMHQAAKNSHWVDNSKVNETRSNLWGAPEEQDGELERSLSGQRSTLQELYPSMLSQIGEAWRRQHVSDAAVGVLRRYHRLRWSSNRNLNRTFNSTLRPAHRKPDLNISQSILPTSQNTTLNVSNPKSPKFNLKRTNGTHPPPQTKVILQKWPAERQSPRKRTNSGNGQPSRPFPLMDFSSCPSSGGSSPPSAPPSSPPSAASSPPSAASSAPSSPPSAASSAPSSPPSAASSAPSSPPSAASSAPSSPPSTASSADSSLQENPELDEAPLNQTFTESMSSAPPTRVRYTTLVFSPDRSEGPSTAGGLSSPSLRCAVPSQRIFTAVRPVVSMEMSSDTERSVYRSSAAQSPYRARLLSWEGQRASPNTDHRSLKSGVAGYQRNMVTVEPRSSPAFSPSFQSPLSPRKLHHLDACSTSQLKVHSSRVTHQESTAGAAQPKLQRHYSLDSFSPSISLRNSTKQIDEDFQKLYHKLVCQGKSVPSCRMCERRAETTRGPSSSALAALALSPHHSVMRKRRRELVQKHSPESKRFRDNSCVYSPGSLRQRREMIRCQNRLDSHLSSIQRDISCDSHTWSPHRASLSQIRHSPHHYADAAVRKAAGSWSGLHVDQPSPACRAKYNRFVGIHPGKSPVKAECQCGCSPSFSRRQLLYK